MFLEILFLDNNYYECGVITKQYLKKIIFY